MGIVPHLATIGAVDWLIISCVEKQMWNVRSCEHCSIFYWDWPLRSKYGWASLGSSGLVLTALVFAGIGCAGWANNVCVMCYV